MRQPNRQTTANILVDKSLSSSTVIGPSTWRDMFSLLPYFTAEAPTCFDSYNQPRLGGGRLFEHAALNRGSAHLSQLSPCCPVAV